MTGDVGIFLQALVVVVSLQALVQALDILLRTPHGNGSDGSWQTMVLKCPPLCSLKRPFSAGAG